MLHTVNRGDRINADDINQFVDVYQEHPTDNIFGTNRGVLIQNGSKIHNSSFDNCSFKQIQEVAGPTGNKVIVQLGTDYNEALKMLDVDSIYSVTSGNAAELSTWNWYGYTEQKPIDKDKMLPSGFAVTQISDFNDYIYGYETTVKVNDKLKNIYVFSSLNEGKTKDELNNNGLSVTNFTKSDILAIKTNYSIQNIYRQQKKDDPIIKQFTLRGVVETRTISSDEGDKKQYRWKTQWYSHYNAETQTDNYAVKFNDKDIRFDGGTEESTPMEGWNEISSSNEWRDSISVDTDVYLNVQVDILGYEEHTEEKDEWKYNEGRTCYSVEISALSSPGWFRRGSVMSHDEGGDAVSSDGYYVRTSYKLGSININDERVRVKQIFDGTQTFVAPYFEDNPISSDEDVYDVPDSEIKEVGLSSLERNLCVLTSLVSSDVGGKIEWDEVSTTYQCWSLYDFRDPEVKKFDNVSLSSDEDEEGTKRQFVIREEKGNGEVVLRYAELSLDLSNDLSAALSDVNGKIDDLSADAKADSEVSSIGLSSIQRFVYEDEDGKERKAYSLFNFDKPDNDLVLRHKDLLNDTWKVLVRDGDQKTLRYAEISSYNADSQSTGEQFNSLEIDEDSDIIGLYNFRKDERHSLEIAVPSLQDYYFQGLDKMEPKGSDSNNMDIVVRNKNSGQHTIDYRILSIQIPPFIHGDADDFIGPTHWSIDSVPNTAMPHVSYYQLHNFGYPDPTTVNNDLVSGDYYNLANGKKKGEDDEDEDLFLIRDENGELVYRKLYAKAESGESWDEQRIVNIENNISYYGDTITEIRGDICCIYGEISGLSSAIEGLSDDFWVKGGDYSDCYGSSIGNSHKTNVIGLDSKKLIGGWGTDERFDVGGTFQCQSDIYGLANAYINDLVQCGSLAVEGDCEVNGDLDVNGHTIKNLDELDVQTQINVPIVNCIQVNSATGGAVDIGGTLNVTGNSITVGGVTVTATQLQQLLALLNSANNILNQSF